MPADRRLSRISQQSQLAVAQIEWACRGARIKTERDVRRQPESRGQIKVNLEISFAESEMNVTFF
jgi:hypothetical protein